MDFLKSRNVPILCKKIIKHYRKTPLTTTPVLCLQHCCHPLARGQQAAPAYRIVVLFIHSARSATGGKPQITITIQVSIHALLAECDPI